MEPTRREFLKLMRAAAVVAILPEAVFAQNAGGKYLVFKDLPLGDFGNKLPAITVDLVSLTGWYHTEATLVYVKDMKETVDKSKAIWKYSYSADFVALIPDHCKVQKVYADGKNVTNSYTQNRSRVFHAN